MITILMGIGIWGLIIFGWILALCWSVMLAISLTMILYALALGVYKTIRFLIKGER